MAVITPQSLSLAGVTPTYNAASSGGDSFPNDGKTYVHVKNGSGGSLTVTFNAIPSSVSDVTYGDLTVADTAIAVPAGEERIVGNFPPARFNNADGGVDMTYSGVSSLTVAVVKEGKSYV